MSEKKIPVPSPLFVGAKELSFFNSVTKELVQKVVSQRLTYYSVSSEHTKAHDLYDEAITKTVFIPLEINALVYYDAPEQTNTSFSIDTIYKIEIYFHLYELEERNIKPKEGDFVKFGEIMYEIQNLTQPQITFGQINEKVMTKAVCIVSRKSQFEIKE
jgi:hypothetical protein